MRKTENLVIENLLNQMKDMNMPTFFILDLFLVKERLWKVPERLEEQGIKVNTLQIRQLHPFPKDTIQQSIDKASKVVVAEHNYQGQLSSILK